MKTNFLFAWFLENIVTEITYGNTAWNILSPRVIFV